MYRSPGYPGVCFQGDHGAHQRLEAGRKAAQDGVTVLRQMYLSKLYNIAIQCLNTSLISVPSSVLPFVHIHPGTHATFRPNQLETTIPRRVTPGSQFPQAAVTNTTTQYISTSHNSQPKKNRNPPSPFIIKSHSISTSHPPRPSPQHPDPHSPSTPSPHQQTPPSSKSPLSPYKPPAPPPQPSTPRPDGPN